MMVILYVVNTILTRVKAGTFVRKSVQLFPVQRIRIWTRLVSSQTVVSEWGIF